MNLDLTKVEAAYLAYVIRNDLETLENGDWQEFEHRIEREVAVRLLYRLEYFVDN